jgi:uncharacterized linocin/CFP29 family protein
VGFLHRSQAPLAEKAWQEIDDAVSQILRAQLRGRAVVDVDGPLGLEAAAVGLGRLDVGANPEPGKVGWGVHRVQPLIEVRVDFELDRWELDNLARGAEDVDLGPAEDAATAVARFEDNAVFNGFQDGSITGLATLAEHEPVALPLDRDGFLESVARGILALRDAGIDGPYALVLGKEAYHFLATQTGGYPLEKQVRSLLDAPVIYAPVVDGAVLVSQRGGDFALTLGQDLVVGYEGRSSDKVMLFLTESFTFRVIEPGACLALPLNAQKRAKTSRR